MLLKTYYAQNYAGTIDLGLSETRVQFYKSTCYPICSPCATAYQPVEQRYTKLKHKE